VPHPLQTLFVLLVWGLVLGAPVLGLLVGLCAWPRWLYIACPLPSAILAVDLYSQRLVNDTAIFFAWICATFAALTVILEMAGYLVARSRRDNRQPQGRW
jgi:hypothetical protein